MQKEQTSTNELTVTDHDRGRAGLKYVYPVLSRRSGGLSIGINLNPNNACNWRCIYCQVPGLVRGGAPSIDLQLLERELTAFLASVGDGSFFDAYRVPAEQRIIRDIAISGNGEPTGSPVFDRVIEVIGNVCAMPQRQPAFARVLITNGSLMRRAAVQRGLAGWKKQGGEIWFKLDSATPMGAKLINNAAFSAQSTLKRLATAASYCPVWIQTCLFGTTPSGIPHLIDSTPDISDSPIFERRGKGVPALDLYQTSQQLAYIKLLQTALAQGIELQGVLLYGPARRVMQPEASRITPPAPNDMRVFAETVRKETGLTVKAAE